MAHHPFSSREVQAAFAAYPQPIRARLLALRDLIREAGAGVSEAGGLEESLKWGAPAWRPKRSRVGSTLRIAHHGSSSENIAMFVHCQTRLADEFRETYGAELEIDGARAVVFRPDQKLPRAIIRHCATMAFTYYLRKR